MFAILFLQGRDVAHVAPGGVTGLGLRHAAADIIGRKQLGVFLDGFIEMEGAVFAEDRL